MKLFGESYVEAVDNVGRVVRTELFPAEHRHNRAVKRIAERFPRPTYLVRSGRLPGAIKTFHGLTGDDLKALAKEYAISEEVLQRAAEDERRRIASISETIRFLFEKYAMVIGASAAFMITCTFFWLSEHYETRLYLTGLLKNGFGIKTNTLLDGPYAFGGALAFFAATICFLRVHLGDWFSGFVTAWIFYVLPTFFVYLVVEFVVYRVVGFFDHLF